MAAGCGSLCKQRLHFLGGSEQAASLAALGCNLSLSGHLTIITQRLWQTLHCGCDKLWALFTLTHTGSTTCSTLMNRHTNLLKTRRETIFKATFLKAINWEIFQTLGMGTYVLFLGLHNNKSTLVTVRSNISVNICICWFASQCFLNEMLIAFKVFITFLFFYC